MAMSASATRHDPLRPATDEPLLHGGDLGAARRLFPDAPEPFIDLSTGINPNPYPLPHLAGRIFRALAGSRRASRARGRRRDTPTARRRRRMSCRRRARRFCCRSSPAWCRPGRAADRGADLCRTRPRRGAGRASRSPRSRDLGAIGDADLVIVGQSQQSGRPAVRQGRALLALAEQLRARGGMLVVDEAFMDVGPPGASLAGDVDSRQHRRAALVRQILRPCRAAARLCARRAAARRAACGAARALGGFRAGARRRHARRWPIGLDRADAATAWRRASAAARRAPDRRRPRHCRRHDIVPAGAHARGARAVPPSRPRRHPGARVSRSCRLAALRPAGRGADWQRLEMRAGRLPRHGRLQLASVRRAETSPTPAAAPIGGVRSSVPRALARPSGLAARRSALPARSAARRRSWKRLSSSPASRRRSA